MLSGLVMALSVAMSPGECTTCGPGGGMAFSPGMASGSWVAGAGGGYNPYDAVGAGGGGGLQNKSLSLKIALQDGDSILPPWREFDYSIIAAGVSARAPTVPQATSP